MRVFKVWWIVIRQGKLLKYLGIIWVIVGAYDLISNQLIKEKSFKISDVLPDWDWKYWVIFALFLLLIITIEGIYRKENTIARGNWITYYELRNGKFPPIPDYLLSVVQRYGKGSPITKDIELCPMSGQFWNNLLPSQREELKQLVNG